MLSNETEHVKVVDAMSYVPSPTGKCYGNIIVSQTLSSGSTLSPPGQPHNEVFESLTGANNEFRGLAVPRRRVRRR